MCILNWYIEKDFLNRSSIHEKKVKKSRKNAPLSNKKILLINMLSPWFQILGCPGGGRLRVGSSQGLQAQIYQGKPTHNSDNTHYYDDQQGRIRYTFVRQYPDQLSFHSVPVNFFLRLILLYVTKFIPGTHLFGQLWYVKKKCRYTLQNLYVYFYIRLQILCSHFIPIC